MEGFFAGDLKPSFSRRRSGGGFAGQVFACTDPSTRKQKRKEKKVRSAAAQRKNVTYDWGLKTKGQGGLL